MKLIFKLTEKDNGAGELICRWRSEGNYLAVAGTNSFIRIYDKSGKVIDEFDLDGPTQNMEWDRFGNILAITTVDSPFLTLWELSSKKIDRLDCSVGSKEYPTFLCWSQDQSLLALGNNRGNLILYDHQTSKKSPIVGKHQRAIISGCFTSDNLLVLSSEDSSISVSNLDGENLACLICNAPAEMIKAHRFKKLRDESQPKDANEHDTELYISGIIGNKSLILLNSNDFENPVNLQFQQKYGDVASYLWFVDGCILLGFSNGYIVCISAQPSEMGQELYVIQEFKTMLSNVSLNTTTNELLSVGDSHLKIRSIDNISEVTDILEVDFDSKGPAMACTNYDGQFVFVTGHNGMVLMYLLKLPTIGAACKDCSVTLSSLTELTLQFSGPSGDEVTKFQIKFEPNLIAISSKFIAVVLNNRVWFYTYSRKGGELRTEFEYISSITSIKINDEFAAAMVTGGKLQLNKILSDSGYDDERNQSLIFPDSFEANVKRIKKESDLKIECMDLSERFLIYTTTYNEIKHFSLREWTFVNEYKHNTGIKWLSTEKDGLRLCFYDNKMETFLYSPLNNKLISFNSTTSIKVNFKNCLWENFTIDKNSFITYDDYTFFIYLIEKKESTEYKLTYINSQKIPYGMKPLMLNKGIVTCLSSKGKINSVLLESFKMDMLTNIDVEKVCFE
uniref:WD repeat domain 19 (inferred by orthology to a human protein) n=1 Tax=Strongyloides venezuelensis TaxID=75913 RepID=A0A0K0G027_STRVS